MTLYDYAVILAQAAPPAGTQQDPRNQGLFTVGMFAVMIFMLWFMVMRPQSKKQKDHAAMLKTMKPGDKIVTNGGIIGVVVSVKEKTISLRSAEAKMEVLKSAVTDIVERAGESAAAEAKAS